MIDSQTKRVFGWSLGFSFLLHLSFIATPTGWWVRLLPAEEVPISMDAVLIPLPSPTPSPPITQSKTQSKRPATPEVPPITKAVTPESPTNGAAIESPPEFLPQSVTVNTPIIEPSPAITAPAIPPVQRPVVRELPERVTLNYAVHMGENGFKAGRATFVWLRQGTRYSLVSTTAATGLVSLFVSGRIVQVSEGEIAADGLRPSRYWLQRGEQRHDQAQFDWPARRLVLGGEGQRLPDTTQDLLSFPFHLALTARPDEAEFVLPVCNGRRLKSYRVRSLGIETLNGHMAWHFQGSREGEGVLDIWLDPDHNNLPTQIRTLDAKGTVMVLTLEPLGT